MLASFQGQLRFSLAGGTFESEHDFLGGFGFLVEDGFGLAAVPGLFAVVAAFSLGE
jgi:hypothetical protein